MSLNPYQKRPSKFYWKPGVVDFRPEFFPPCLHEKKWGILKDWRLATAGSCFAQHISSRLKAIGSNFLDYELAPKNIPTEIAKKYGYSLYSARYGNIYTTRQLVQLASELSEPIDPRLYVWKRDDRYFDAFRQSVTPSGLDSYQEVIRSRELHLDQVRKVFMDMDVFIFTLGLTESWIDRETKIIYPTAPGVIAGSYSPDTYQFINLTLQNVVDDIELFLEIINKLRNTDGRKPLKILLSVSPVPLTATMTSLHILQANSVSKSVLRAAAHHLFSNIDTVDYFPSYEIITNLASRGMYYRENLREVNAGGVDIVMSMFFSEYPELSVEQVDGPQSMPIAEESDSNSFCEEKILETFANK